MSDSPTRTAEGSDCEGFVSRKEDTEWWNKPLPPPESSDALISEHMAQCQRAVRFIMSFLYSADTTLHEGLAAAKTAARLMAMNMKLNDALGGEKKREFVHHLIVEHKSAPHMIERVKVLTTAPLAPMEPIPPPPAEIVQTIRCGANEEGYDIE